jgi:hypothetical protein
VAVHARHTSVGCAVSTCAVASQSDSHCAHANGKSQSKKHNVLTPMCSILRALPSPSSHPVCHLYLSFNKEMR